MPRTFSIVLLAWLVALSATGGAGAQVATPASDPLFSGLGLPELVLTATDDGLTLSHTEVPAGRYLITLDNHSWDDLAIEILRFGPDPSIGDYSCRDGLPPHCFSWYPYVYLPGGVSAPSSQAVLDLKGGEYGLWGAGILGEQPAAQLTVVGDRDAAVAGPEPAAATIALEPADNGEYAIRVEGALRAGRHLVQVANFTDRPILLYAGQYPDPTSVAAVSTTDAAAMSSPITPSPDALDIDLFRDVMATVPQSPGTRQWLAIDLVPGQLHLAGYFPQPFSQETGSNWVQVSAAVVPVAAE